MPPSVIPPHMLSPHHQLHHAPSRRELSSSSSSAFLYSTAHLSAKDAAASARDLKRHRSSILEDSPPAAEGRAATARTSTSTSKAVPPTPGKKPSLIQKKPAAAQLYIKTSSSRNPTSSSSNHQARPPSAVPTTPTTVTSPNAVRSPTSFSTLASPTSPPLKRKQPARFSSNGISTSAGPPPSLAYRKTNGLEQQRNYTPQTPTSTRTREISSTPITIRGGGGAQQLERMDEDGGDQDRTIRGLEDLPRQSIDYRGDEDEDTAMADYDSNKELFLSLAKAEPPKVGINASKRTQERQQSRINQRSSMPPARPVSHSDASDVSPLTTFTTNRKSVPVPMVDALAEAMEHGPRDVDSRGLSSLKREASMERIANSNKFGALNINPTPKTLNPSPLQKDRTIASMLEQDKLDRANANGSVAGDTASTVSTNAASVWDELEELKSRIHKLELTGNAGYGKGSDTSGRPRTATTTATTLSSSPRNNIAPGQSPSGTTLGNIVHPLLQQALSRTKQLIDPEVYQALEATAKDAFSLVDIVGTNGAISSPVSVNGGVDRQIRKKVDSLCRSLTELSIALSEAANNQQPQNSAAAPPAANPTPSGSFTSADSYSSQRSHLGGLGRPMTREGASESRREILEERAGTGLGIRSGRDSVLSDRKLISRRLEIVDPPRRPSMQNLATPAALQGLQQSVSYSDITRRAAPGSSAGMDAALKLERAKAQRAEAMGREPMSRDGQIDHIMQDLDMQESTFRSPSRATTDMLRSRRRAEERTALEREREIEQLTQELNTSRRPTMFHNRTSSSATVTQSSVVTQRNSPLSISQPATRNSPLSARRSLDRDREDAAQVGTMDRIARRTLLTRSMQEPVTQPLSPVESGRRFFDEREAREREVLRAQRNTIHVEGGYASVAAAAAGRRDTGYSALEVKRKSHSGAMAGVPGRVLRSAGGGMDYDDGEAVMDRERERLATREGEGRRFLRRRVE